MSDIFRFLIIFSLFITVKSFFTRIPEGHVGIYSFLEQIDSKTIKSSSAYFPLISTITLVKYIQDTDNVANVNCVSSEGVNINIPNIEIANKIDPNKVVSTIKEYGFDYDKKLVVRPLAQYMRELCAKRTVDQIEITDFANLDDLLKVEIQRQNNDLGTGITIDYVRLDSPVIPEQLKKKKVELAEEKANKILAEERIKRIETEKAAEVLVAIRDNDIKQENAKRDNERILQNAQAEREKKGIENAMLLEQTQTNVQRIRLEAIANAEKMELEARALRQLYDIPEYANVQKANAISDKTSMVYFGDKVPSFLPYGTQLPQKAT